VGTDLLAALFGRMPLRWYEPFRRGAVEFRRGTFPRSLSIAILKIAARGHRACRVVEKIVPKDVPSLSFNASDSMVLEAVYWFGVQGYEGRVADIWDSLCRTSDATLEVGGNIGFYTVLGARAARGRYTVVEPVPRLAAALRANLESNALRTVSVLEGAAIPDTASRIVRLNVPDEGREAPVGAHLVEDVEIGGRGTLQTLSVAGIPFRSLMEGCDLVKIDAEGIEFELLSSVEDLILKNRPTLLIEVLPEATSLARLLSVLAQKAGYGIYVLPEYGSDTIVAIPSSEFSAASPKKYCAKDVLLSVMPPPQSQTLYRAA
jgi:FkbM family methyltransferase